MEPHSPQAQAAPGASPTGLPRSPLVPRRSRLATISAVYNPPSPTLPHPSPGGALPSPSASAHPSHPSANAHPPHPSHLSAHPSLHSALARDSTPPSARAHPSTRAQPQPMTPRVAGASSSSSQPASGGPVAAFQERLAHHLPDLAQVLAAMAPAAAAPISGPVRRTNSSAASETDLQERNGRSPMLFSARRTSDGGEGDASGAELHMTDPVAQRIRGRTYSGLVSSAQPPPVAPAPTARMHSEAEMSSTSLGMPFRVSRALSRAQPLRFLLGRTDSMSMTGETPRDRSDAFSDMDSPLAMNPPPPAPAPPGDLFGSGSTPLSFRDRRATVLLSRHSASFPDATVESMHALPTQGLSATSPAPSALIRRATAAYLPLDEVSLPSGAAAAPDRPGDGAFALGRFDLDALVRDRSMTHRLTTARPGVTPRLAQTDWGAHVSASMEPSAFFGQRSFESLQNDSPFAASLLVSPRPLTGRVKVPAGKCDAGDDVVQPHSAETSRASLSDGEEFELLERLTEFSDEDGPGFPEGLNYFVIGESMPTCNRSLLETIYIGDDVFCAPGMKKKLLWAASRGPFLRDNEYQGLPPEQFKISQKIMALPQYNLLKQSVEVLPASGLPLLESATLRHPHAPRYLLGALHTELDTLAACFFDSCRRFADVSFTGIANDPVTDRSADNCRWQNYEFVKRRVYYVSSALCFAGLSARSCVTVWSRSREEVFLVALACTVQPFLFAPLSASMVVEEALSTIISKIAAEALFVEHELWNSLPDALRFAVLSAPAMRLVVVFANAMDDYRASEPNEIPFFSPRTPAAARRAPLVPWLSFERTGFFHPYELRFPRACESYMIAHTEGTMGLVRRALLTHENFVSIAASTVLALGLKVTDRVLAHVPIGQPVYYVLAIAAMMVGASVQFEPEHTADGLLDALPRLRPSVLLTSSRLLKEVHKKLITVARGVARLHASLVMAAVHERVSGQHSPNSGAWWTGPLLKLMRRRFGGQLRAVVSTGSVLAAPLLDFFRNVVGCPVVQSYGMAECCGLAAMQFVTDPERRSSIGPPLHCVEVKLIDAPKLGLYTHEEPRRGLLCLRGRSVGRGYYRMPTLTMESYDQDGWFHAGDVCEIRRDGALAFLGRTESIDRLPCSGESVFVEVLEAVYASLDFVDYVFAAAHWSEDAVVCVVFVDAAVIARMLHDGGVSADGMGEMQFVATHLNVAWLYDDIYLAMKEVAESHSLPSSHYIRCFRLLLRGADSDETMLTPARKLCRLPRDEVLRLVRELHDPV